MSYAPVHNLADSLFAYLKARVREGDEEAGRLLEVFRKPEAARRATRNRATRIRRKQRGR
jgi:hypothetical protein